MTEVDVKLKVILKLYVKFIGFLYLIRMNGLADKLFSDLMDGIEADVGKYINVNHIKE